MTGKGKNAPDIELSRLNTWYQDSLALIRSDNSKKQGHFSFDSAVGNTGFGILVLEKNAEVHAEGDAEMCRQHLRELDHAKLLQHGITVQTKDGCFFLVSSLNNNIRVVSVNRNRCSRLLSEMFPEVRISEAEFRVLEQLVCGATLREAAREDDVSYETKRAQFKALSAKTGFGNQSDAVRIFLAAILSHTLPRPAVKPVNPNQSRSAGKSFLELYYPETFRFHEVSMKNGRILRVADAGPPGGKPVVFAHSQTLPKPDQIQTEWLEKSNTRLLVPLRCGFLDLISNPPGVKDHLETSAREIVDTIQLFCGSPVRLVAQSTGSPYALRATWQAPELVRELVIAAAAHLGKYNDGKINTFVEAIRKLAMKSDIILDKTYEQYQKRMSTVEGFAKLLRTTYRNSKPDQEVFSEILSSPLTYSWLFESYRLSRWSIMRDIAAGNMDVWSGADKIKRPVVFVHGSHDPINPPDAARRIRKAVPDSSFVELPDHGQSLFLSLFKELVTFEGGKWHKLETIRSSQ